jgi:hypothetical protein
VLSVLSENRASKGSSEAIGWFKDDVWAWATGEIALTAAKQTPTIKERTSIFGIAALSK